jgi:hypothetical protein
MTPAQQIVMRLMQTYKPDMDRHDDRISNHMDFQGKDIKRMCYSEEQLQLMLDDRDLVGAICRANDGEPMWELSVRNYLFAWVAS